MENRNGIHIIDCECIVTKPLIEVQDTDEFKTFAERLGNGLKLNGIVYLTGTSIDETVVSNLDEKLGQLFSLPLDIKEEYRPTTFGLSKYGSWGWKGPFKKVVAETLDFTSNPRFEEDYLYPNENSGFKDAIMEFRKQSRNLMIKLLRSLGEYLELTDKDFFIHQHRAFEDNYEKSKCSVRSVYYPKELHNRKSATRLRLPEHQDFGTINLIRQNAGGGGLQAKINTGKWVDVPYIANSFVLIAARCLEMYSGGNIPAVYHRIAWTDRSETEDRLSFGCFWGPDRDTCVLSQVKENPTWKPAYTRMQPGEMFDDYFHKEKPAFFGQSNNNRKTKTFKTLTGYAFRYHRIAWMDRSETKDRLSFGCFWGPDRDTCVLSQVKENPTWKPAYTRMQPGEMFDDYFHKEKPAFFGQSNNNRKTKTFKTLTGYEESL